MKQVIQRKKLQECIGLEDAAALFEDHKCVIALVSDKTVRVMAQSQYQGKYAFVGIHPSLWPCYSSQTVELCMQHALDDDDADIYVFADSAELLKVAKAEHWSFEKTS